MKQLIAYIFILLTVFVTASCEDVIDVKLDQAEPQICFDAILTNEQKPQVIKITRSIPYFDNSGNFPVMSADSVVMTDQNGKRFIFTENQGGEYVFTPSGADTFAPENHYILKIYRGSDLYTAESTMKRAASVDSITYTALKSGGGFGGTALSGYTVLLHAKDLPGKGNCYWVRTYRNGNFLNKPSQINAVFDAGFAGANTDTMKFIFPIAFLPLNDFENPYQLGDKVKVEIAGISQGFYDFLLLAKQQLQNGGLFAPPPVNVRSNFTSNRPEAMTPVGYFNICESKSLEVEIVE